MNGSTIPEPEGTSGDAWDAALLSQPASVSAREKEETQVFQRSYLDFTPDKKIASTEGGPSGLLLPSAWMSTLPIRRQSQVPALPTGHALVPLSGMVAAVGLLFVAQAFIPVWNEADLALVDFVPTEQLSRLVVEPSVEIIDRVGIESSLLLSSARSKIVALQTFASDVATSPLVSTTAPASPKNVSAIAATSVSAPVFDLFWGRVVQIFAAIWDSLIYYKDLALTNWRNFWSGEPAVALVTPDEAALRAQIKAEVLAELRGDLAPLLGATGPTLTQTNSGQGVVVVPQSQVGNQTDAVAKIKSLFSDPVLVDFDTTGQSGVITPLFGNVTGENYIFVLTPIASQ